MRELVKPETQLSEQDQKLFLFKPSPILPTFLTHDIDLNNKHADDLLFATHDLTNVTFLADSGAGGNLIREDIAKHCYPDAWAERERKKNIISGARI